jgi:NhaP-type Na+/H+ or K+/H+ antiporter
MTPFELVAALMSVVALAGWLNVKTLHLPHGVAMLIAGLIGAGTLFVLQGVLPQFEVGRQISDYFNHIDFVSTVTCYMLAFLLFAGAMQVDLGEMRKRWLSVAALATLGVAGSIVVVDFGLWLDEFNCARRPDHEHCARSGLDDALEPLFAFTIPQLFPGRLYRYYSARFPIRKRASK